MKIKIWAVPLACLAVFMMFAGSAPAQEDNEAPPNPRLQKILDDFRSPSDSNRAASAGRTSQQQASEAVTTETSACAYTFTSGSGNSYLQYCVTVNGNIVESKAL